LGCSSPHRLAKAGIVPARSRPKVPPDRSQTPLLPVEANRPSLFWAVVLSFGLTALRRRPAQSPHDQREDLATIQRQAEGFLAQKTGCPSCRGGETNGQTGCSPATLITTEQEVGRQMLLHQPTPAAAADRPEANKVAARLKGGPG